MDSITQAALGAAIGQSILGKKASPKGAILGAAIATIPDLDVLLYAIYEPYEMLSIHRGLSHSILFSLIGGVIISYILSTWEKLKNISLLRLLFFTWLCLITHSLLDTFTAYGTQLLMPFSDVRIGFDSINVVDPLYTVPLLIGLILSLWKKKHQFNNWGLILSTIYLGFTLINKQHVHSNLEAIFTSKGINYQQLLSMPVGIANLNWYGVARTSDSIHMRKYSVLNDDDTEVFSFPINDFLLDEIEPEVAEIMRWFAKGYYTVEKIDNVIRIYNLQVDMRGVISTDKTYAPTAGYFEFTKQNDSLIYSTGTIVIE